MAKAVRHKSSFNAVDDEGRTHVLRECVDIIDAGTLGDPNAEEEGMKSIITSDGGSVNRLDKGHYQVVGTGQHLFSDDPNAP